MDPGIRLRGAALVVLTALPEPRRYA